MKITLEHTAITWFGNHLLVVESQYQFQRKDWGRVFNNHEAIISRKMFDQVRDQKNQTELLRMWTILN